MWAEAEQIQTVFTFKDFVHCSTSFYPHGNKEAAMQMTVSHYGDHIIMAPARQKEINYGEMFLF